MSDRLLSHAGPGWRWLDRHLLAVAIILSGAVFVPGLIIGPSWSNSLPDALILLPVALSFLVGWRTELPGSAVGLVALAFSITAGDFSDALVPMIVFATPPWVMGRVMRSRAGLSAQLSERAQQLELEREAFARESVRYERARIARDLHDVVAHNLSMIVVQAAAGRRAIAQAPEIAADSLLHIQGGAQSARLEIAQLVELLGDEHPERERGDGLSQLDELVRRAAAGGLAVTYSFSGGREHVSIELADLAYHVVQEGITNALKHAPRSVIAVDVAAGRTELTVAVVNDRPEDEAEPLAETGGGFGLSGLRERVAVLHGTLESGPTAGGGWRLSARVPSAP
jgi:signal transduction histidine kinase